MVKVVSLPIVASHSDIRARMYAGTGAIFSCWLSGLHLDDEAHRAGSAHIETEKHNKGSGSGTRGTGMSGLS